MSDPIRRRLILPGSPACKILVGNCLDIMPLLPAGQFDCIFADPPFNMGEGYSEWNDNIDIVAYRGWTERWLNYCVKLLSDRGNLWINCPDHIVSYIDNHLERNLRLVRANWCIWHYRFGVWRDSGFINSKTHCLRFVKDKSLAIWNADSVLVESDRRKHYGDKRTEEKSKNPGMRVPLDTWGVPSDGEGWDAAAGVADVWGVPVDGEFWGRVQGNNKERSQSLWEHPNQLPEKYLERAIRCSTVDGSLFFTPFVGSGTELTVARALGHASMGIEIGDKEADSAFDRINRGSVRIKKVN